MKVTKDTLNSRQPLATLKEVSRRFHNAESFALQDVNLEVFPTDRLVIMGPSGSGKSSLLHLLAGLDMPTSGCVRFDDQDLASLSAAERARYRLRNMGFVFQFFNLLPTLTAAENTALPLELGGVPRKRALDQANRLLTQVGLLSLAHRYPEHLSGGEMQRVALARALVTSPRLIIADEPTGNLDLDTGRAVLDLLEAAVASTDEGSPEALVMVTHDSSARRIGNRQFLMRDGCLLESEPGSDVPKRSAL